MQYSRLLYPIWIAILIVSFIGIVWYGWNIVRTGAEIQRLQQAITSFQEEQPTREVLPDEARGVLPVVPVDTVSSSEHVMTPVSDTTDLLATLPVRIHLTVPFTSQAPERNWDQPWQDACEEAAILMLDAYYKGYNLSPLFSRDELLKMVEWQQERGWGGSIPIAHIRETAAWFMHDHRDEFLMVERPSIADIKAFVAAGHPVLAVGDGRILNNPYFSGEGPPYHALLIIGYDDATGEFITNDPGTQHGKDFRYAYENVMTALADWNNGDVSNGTPVVLVKQ